MCNRHRLVPRRRRRSCALWAVIAALGHGSALEADIFTYQGELRQSGNPAQDGMYTFEFSLMSSETDGFLVSAPIVMALPVTDGRFTAELNIASLPFILQLDFNDAEFQKACDFSTPDVLSLKIQEHFTTTLSAGDNFITFRYQDWDHGDTSVGAIQGNGAGGVMLAGPGNDYAEWLPNLDPREEIEAGDIVGVHGGKITRTTTGSSQVMAMSAAPIVLGNRPAEDDEEPSALQTVHKIHFSLQRWVVAHASAS